MESSDDEATSASFVSTEEREDVYEHDFLFGKPQLRRQKTHETKKKADLPNFVSAWKKSHLRSLNIFYNKSYVNSPFDVLLKTDNIDEFSELQKQYIETVKSYLHFDAVHVKNEKNQHTLGTFYSSYLKPLFDDIRRLLNPSENTDTLGIETDIGGSISREGRTDCNIYLDVKAKVYVDDFIKELTKLLKTYEDHCKDPKTHISERMYHQLFLSFATMCHLKPSFGDADPGYWPCLRGVEVSSKPVFRLCKRRMLFEDYEDPCSVVSFVEVKRSTQQKDNEEPLKKRRKVTDFTSSDDTDEMDSRINMLLSSTSTSSLMTDDSIGGKPDIELDLSKEVLGQHAGELLLDLRKFMYPYDKTKMSGMIVKGTKVYFTMLEMTDAHLDKLLNNMKLDKNKDIGTIFYSKPLDILVEEDRVTLIENFMRLNNLHTKEK